MSFYDLMTMSMGNLWRRKLRTVLTVLGVLIGTTSIVAMLSLAFGMKQMILDEYASMGSVTQIIISGGGGDMDSSSSRTDTSTMLTETNMQMFQDMEHVKNVLPQLSFDGNMQSGRYSGYGNLIGVDQSILIPGVREGRYPTEGKCRYASGDRRQSDPDRVWICSGRSVCGLLFHRRASEDRSDDTDQTAAGV